MNNPATTDDLSFGETLRGFSAGQRLARGRYTLKKILGRGGMGIVWLARDEELERDIAVKFLPEMVVNDKEAVGELKRETRRSLELTHPNLVRIYDFVQDTNWAGIAMEYVDGGTLSALKVDQPGGCFDAEQLAGWIGQLCTALDYAHEQAKVVHRDLKPANLMVNSRDQLKVADFGIARSVSDSMSRLTVAQSTSGTLVYMSPQQAMGEDPSVTDDVYSLGATLYELLTSKPPFYSGDVISQLREKIPPPMEERRGKLGIEGKAEIPAHWEVLVASCLAKKPEDRPGRMKDIAARLTAPAPIVAPKVGSIPAPMVKKVPRNRIRNYLAQIDFKFATVGTLVAILFNVSWSWPLWALHQMPQDVGVYMIVSVGVALALIKMPLARYTPYKFTIKDVLGCSLIGMVYGGIIAIFFAITLDDLSKIGGPLFLIAVVLCLFLYWSHQSVMNFRKTALTNNKS